VIPSDRNVSRAPSGDQAASTEQQELLGIVGPLRSDIVEVESADTGTPLPDSYEAAPPLARV
jgi:hypothetical protein